MTSYRGANQQEHSVRSIRERVDRAVSLRSPSSAAVVPTFQCSAKTSRGCELERPRWSSRHRVSDEFARGHRSQQGLPAHCSLTRSASERHSNGVPKYPIRIGIRSIGTRSIGIRSFEQPSPGIRSGSGLKYEVGMVGSSGACWKTPHHSNNNSAANSLLLAIRTRPFTPA